MKLEQHPKRKEAMAIFNAEFRNELKPAHINQVANKLKEDDTASFFFHMHKDNHWNWLKEEAGVSAEYE
ncbi:uncharacterized protein MELLADRAFT_73059 [Melampsora larici-populina 98AG31]|uniref:Uncharacterized protein n=1 Tax=Melampsora larici-populina (strain 98AG31 / pathotype 3-4-7) TaxID=747676 RepID=F4S2E9_MELLP|nr:uncharacterized protein MELLADRAFT_73059 [Melampsora larici-populina 98AG31]EGG01218.1 hypothetical protein MELLADRAFT_73059 [Melampsora larici-populina 98AG31]